MTLKEFANITSMFRDIDTGTEVSHTEYMCRVIDKLGLENVARYIPFDIDYLKEKLKRDKNLNNTELRMWNGAAGFIPNINKKTHTLDYIQTHTGLANLFIANGITCFSVSDGVCVLKEAARMLCKEGYDDE